MTVGLVDCRHGGATVEPDERSLLMFGPACDGCGKAIRGQVHRTVTGRELCTDCAGDLLGTTAGMAVGQDLVDTLSIRGWFQRMRARRRGPGDRSST